MSAKPKPKPPLVPPNPGENPLPPNPLAQPPKR